MSEEARDGQTGQVQPGPDFVVRLRPLSHRHTKLTLGMLLKVLGRRYDLQCRDVMEVPREQEIARVTEGKEDRG